jgi:hypothetical protein
MNTLQELLAQYHSSEQANDSIYKQFLAAEVATSGHIRQARVAGARPLR